jgi:Zn-dependent M28 family amino/carboxypeptidase
MSAPTISAKAHRLFRDVDFLTSLNPARNFENIQSLQNAALYISDEFKKTGAKTDVQKWVAWNHEYSNIIASYNREKSKRLIIGAHYDVAGDQPGADDNASGIAGLLELSRLVQEVRPDIDYRIDFVAYCLEEPPFFGTELMGSYVHAESLFKDKVGVLGMICLEMIGYFSDKPNSQQFPSPDMAKIYPHTANFIVVVGITKYVDFNHQVHKLMASDSNIDVQVISFPSGDSLAGLSDDSSYWKFGYRALMINDTAFVRNPNYHRSSDTIDTLDFKKMAEVVNSVFKAAIAVVV